MLLVIGAAYVIAFHAVSGHALHRWLAAQKLVLPVDAGVWAGLLFGVWAVFG